ncbi:MAG TPA: peptidoglycan-binding domain-containing protein [Yinghuangia sp.]|uniref:peptidoglycan-binding protein n=1 Tax=Yinghuangia sp. YIM S10712 TaxID=3436930 RepID=UPI002D01B1DC|nr:peptidoglycan-binding domain-containing protein [Yinghuangia sp.]
MIAGVAAVVALGVGGAVVFSPGDEAEKAASRTQGPGATALVVRGDLTVNAEVDGTLGYGGSGSVIAQAHDVGVSGGEDAGSGGSGATGDPEGGRGGTPPPGGGPSAPPGGSAPAEQPGSRKPTQSPTKPVDKEQKKEEEQYAGRQIFTKLPDVGAVVKQGETMYEVNGRPVPLFYGLSPLWRVLAAGVSNGPDVQMLERNLVALGFGADLSVDEKFTDGTAAAVKRWQKSLGLPQTGRVDPSMVAVQPGAIRVTAVKASIGAPAQGEVAAVSGTGRLVEVKLPVDKQSVARKGDKVTVRLPDGKTTTGTISEIGTVASKDEQDGGMPGQSGGKATVPVTVTLDKPEEAGALDGAPVNVGFTSQTRKGVLSVPVNALVALAEGGYAVEVVDTATGSRKLIGVQPGLFANGRVEITGEGLAEGQNVRVPS